MFRKSQRKEGFVDEFKVGDVVRLKSGGPKMTVEWVEGSRIGVSWIGLGNMPHGFCSMKEIFDHLAKTEKNPLED